MKQEEEILRSQLAQLIKQNKSFVLYRLPLQNNIHFIAQLEGEPQKLSNLSDLNGEKGFLISPFKVETKLPIVLIQPNIEATGYKNITHSLKEYTNENYIEDHSIETTCNVTNDENEEFSLYEKVFANFITALQQGEFRKLVLSRPHRIIRPKDFSCFKAFLQAVEYYPRMMIYMCYTPQTGLWMGCTPEIILSGDKNQWQTVALAGTMPIKTDGTLPNNWDNKNIDEQEVVSEYIRKIVSTYAMQLKENGPYTAQAGNVVHLKTDFSFELRNNKNIGNLLHDLHPTPAVCGFPKQAAFDFIDKNESHSRKYYSGIIGKLDPDGQTDLFVNLRCAEIDQDSITLYAGGGLMPTSSAEQEWQETQYKMQTLLKVIQSKNDNQDVRQ